MMTLPFPTGMKDTIDTMRDLIGRGITITVKEGQIACTLSGCVLDPVTNEATDPFCSGCDGRYWIPVYSGHTISGHIRWGFADQQYWQPGGIIPVGECQVTIEYTEENLDHVRRSDSWIVDDKTMYLKRFQLKGVRSTSEVHGPNRIACYLKEDDD